MAVEKVRVSIGSAAVLNLYQTNRFKELPTTCYIMTYTKGRCMANCGFCPQAREAKSSIEKLSRISWPVFCFKEFLTKLKYLPPKSQFKRVCIQSLNYPNNFKDLVEIVSEVKENTKIPISTAIPPLLIENIQELKKVGVERIGIALDAANAKLFDNIKGKGVNGPYQWDDHIYILKEAQKIFTNGNVTTHIIVGLGETEKDVLSLIDRLISININVGLFAFMPIKGTKLENLKQPDLKMFRKLQLGRFLLVNSLKQLNNFTFNSKDEVIKFDLNKREIWNIIEESSAFETSGCPGCNRPYYTSKPTGPIYNYPRKLTIAEKEEIFTQIIDYID